MRWTPERIAILRQMAGEGRNATEIGEALDLGRGAIYGKARRLEIRIRKAAEGRDPGKYIAKKGDGISAEPFWPRKQVWHMDWRALIQMARVHPDLAPADLLSDFNKAARMAR